MSDVKVILAPEKTLRGSLAGGGTLAGGASIGGGALKGGMSAGGGRVDLTGYAQKSELPTKVSQLENDKGYLTEHQDISGKLDASALPAAVNTALAQAKASGEFDGKDGQDGSPGKDGADGKDGSPGKDGVSAAHSWNGTTLTITSASGTSSADLKGDKGDTGAAGSAGKDGSNGKDGVSATHSWSGTTLTVTSASGTSSANLKGEKGDKGDKGDQGIQGVQGEKGETGASGSNGADGKDGANGTSVTVKSVSESTADGGSNVVTFSDGKTLTVKNGSKGSTGGKGDTGATGQRGTGLLPVTTAPSGYTTAVGGITPKYRMALSTIKTQAGATEVLLGDTVRYSYYHYPIAYLDASYAYFTTRVSIRGATGAAVTIESISESAVDGGENVVTFSDEKTLTVKNGRAGRDGNDGADGYTPVLGKDYYTEADKAEFSEYIASELAKRGQLQPEYANSIEECTDTTKLYVLPDGFIYAYATATTTGAAYTNIFDNIDHKINTRWSHSGRNYSTSSATGHVATAKFPVKDGDIIRINKPSLPHFDGYARVHYFKSDGYYVNGHVDSALRLYTQITETDGISSWEVGTAYNTPNDPTSGVKRLAGAADIVEALIVINVSSTTITEDDVSDIIITVNQPIEESTTTTSQWINTGHAFVPADYEDRIIALETKSAKNAAAIEALKKSVVDTGGVDALTWIRNWDAPIYDANIPVFQLSAEKAAMTNATMTPTALYAMYDALMAKYPYYITKTDLGVCSDGEHHVYRYDFKEPEQRHTSKYRSETKAKAILVSGIHLEWAGMFGLYYALEEITENPALRDFRRNVHLIVIPCSNPFVTLAQHYDRHGGQQNANGVEIHRNFEAAFLYPDNPDYVPFGELHHGGTEPLSEPETQYIDGVLKENTDAALFVTCHNYNLDLEFGMDFIWPSVATAYMCNMGYRLIDKMSNAWMDKYGDLLQPGIESYRFDTVESWDTRLGHARISHSPGTETRQATKYGIQGANVEICERFHVHGTKENPEPLLSSFTMSRGAEVYVNFLLTAFGVYDPKDKKEYAPNLP